MFDDEFEIREETVEERKALCGVCGREIGEHSPCYEIRYGTVMNGRFQRQELYMLVHSSCLKE